jgi:hypothetical protein
MSHELKPCPFCGGEAGWKTGRVGCNSCDIWAHNPHSWNARSPAAPQWISVKDRLPECRLECTSSGTDVSNTVYLLGDSIGGSPGYGIGHLQSDGIWVCYDGEHDFMCITCVTHWMAMPAAPKEPA